jgi:hypothetical protein
VETLLHDMTLRSDPEANLPRAFCESCCLNCLQIVDSKYFFCLTDADSPAGIALAKIRLVYGVNAIQSVGEFKDIVARGSRVSLC